MLTPLSNTGSLLAKKYLAAVENAKVHEDQMSLINAGLEKTLVESWTKRITTWESDRTAENPYYLPQTSECTRVVR